MHQRWTALAEPVNPGCQRKFDDMGRLWYWAERCPYQHSYHAGKGSTTERTG